MIPLSIAVIGNCQAKQIESLMKITSSDCIAIVPTKSVHVLAREDEAEFLNAISHADVLITHPISDSFIIEFCRTSYLRSHFPGSILQISNIYTTAYNSQQSYILDVSGEGRIQGPLDGIHLKNIFESYVNGYNQAQAYINYQTVSRREVLLSVENSLSELKRRDHDYKIEIPLSALLENSLPSSHLLHTFHHPTLELIWIIVEQIHKTLGLRSPDFVDPSLISDHVLRNNGIHVAPHPSSIEILGGKFKTSAFFKGFCEWKISDNNRNIQMLDTQVMSLRRLIDLYYRFYEDLEKLGLLTSNVACKSY